MREKLELKILTLVVILLVIGIIAAGFMVLTIEKKSLYSITEASSAATAGIIVKDVERTMLEGRADITRSIMEDLKVSGGVESIALLDSEGRPAFDKSQPAADGEVMKKMAQTKAPQLIRGVKKLTFYKPLENLEKCKACHANAPQLLGAVKISFSIDKEYSDAIKYIVIVILATLVACFCFSLILWAVIRRLVITPVKKLEDAALKLHDGDLSFNVALEASDEIGRFSRAISESIMSISGILKRIKEASRRVSVVAEDVERESRKVAEGAVLETEAIADISSSVEEMNAVISEIAEGTDGLAASAEETAASMVQMVTSISQINGSTQELSTAVETTSASIEELSATIREVAGNAGELAGAAQDTQSAITQISASIREVENRSKESAVLSDKVKNDAVALGMTSVEKTIKGMQDIKTSVEKTADYIGKLGGRSEEIGKILNVIDEITDQTTMLALNAAILAAQAGEHGKGFSVVADEIKELAERTSLSTQEISELIQAVQKEVGDSVLAMKDGLKAVDVGFRVTQEAADALRKIVESSKKSSEMAMAIEHSTTEQSKAARLVSEAMEKVLNMVGQIANATTEQNRGIQLIMKATEKISDVAAHVRTATNEQSINSKQISQSVDLVSEKSQQISRAIKEQETGSAQILSSIEKIKDLPKENRERAFSLNKMVKTLLKDADLATTEMERFKFTEDTASGGIRMGIVPLESPAEMFRKFSPLADYLGKRLARRMELKVAVDFQAAVEDMGQGVTQVCFMTPSTYIEAHKKYGVRVLLKALRDGKPYQHAVIVTRNDSGINSLEEIKGRSFAFGDRHSTSSHIVPRGMLLDAGVDIKDLQYYNYLGHHDDVARAVLSGDFDAGGIMESAAHKFKDSGLKLIKYSDDIPEFNICVTNSLDAKTVSALTESFIRLNDKAADGALILKSINASYTGFVEATDSDYNNIRAMMSKIGLI